MKFCGIVSEYNPFHYGHQYQIAKTRKILGESTAIVAVMSGNFVQRGDLSLLEKHQRAEMALKNGVDLVLELPLTAALSSAEGFAAGAVAVLAATGLCTHLSFGCETADLSLLAPLSAQLDDGAILARIKARMNQEGASFPSARAAVFGEIDPQYATLLRSPNNILALEYLKAIAPHPIAPLPILRKFTKHDSGETQENFASASLLREKMGNGEDIAPFLPSFSPLQEEIAQGRAPVFLWRLETALLSHLRRMTCDQLCQIQDCGGGLGQRIYHALRETATLEQLVFAVKTKRYTLSRVRRVLLCAFLGITVALAARPPAYIRVLGATATGAALLKTMKTTSSLPILTKNTANYQNDPLFALDILAQDLYSLAYPDLKAQKGGNLFRQSPIFL